jgi:cytochrome bd-type quinol oxidase subunit 2
MPSIGRRWRARWVRHLREPAGLSKEISSLLLAGCFAGFAILFFWLNRSLDDRWMHAVTLMLVLTAGNMAFMSVPELLPKERTVLAFRLRVLGMALSLIGLGLSLAFLAVVIAPLVR